MNARAGDMGRGEGDGGRGGRAFGRVSPPPDCQVGSMPRLIAAQSGMGASGRLPLPRGLGQGDFRTNAFSS